MVTTRSVIRGIVLAAMLVGASTSSVLGADLDPLLGIYPQGALQSNFQLPAVRLPEGITELNAINTWISGTAKRIMITGDFMDPEFPNPDFNVPANLGAILAGHSSGAWVNGYVPFVNLAYYGGGSGPGRSSTEIANGAADVKTRQWAHEFAKWSNRGQKRAFLAPLPEMNGNWTPYYVGGPADFKLAYRRIRTIFEEELAKEGVPATAISWVFAPNNGGSRVPQDNFEAYYPGSDIIDIVAFSAYNQGGCAGNAPWFVWETFDSAIKPYLDRMRAMAPNKPVFLVQTGSVEVQAHGEGDKDVWLDDTFTKLAEYPGLKGVVYYNVKTPNGSTDCPGGFDFRLHDPTTGQWRGFLTALGRPGVNYGDYALNSPELLNVVFARPQQIFDDVLPNHPLLGSAGPLDLSPWIHALYGSGITGGCNTNPLLYCPNGGVTRAQMAVFLLRGIHGAGYNPHAATGTMFGDVPITHSFAKWIEQLAREGVTGGCAVSPSRYCPDGGVTRAQMAVFLLRSKHGAAYDPPAATGTMFGDVPTTHPFAKWIEQLAREGVTGGCSVSPSRYCPDSGVSRAQMAVFLVRTFNL